MNHLFLNNPKHNEGQKHLPSLKIKLFSTFFYSTCYSNCLPC